MSFQTFFLLTTLVASSLAVINIKHAKRREASIADSYGPPPKSSIGLPTPVYGAPAVAHYPPPPPDIPPLPQLPHQEYGPPPQVPYQEYGPPKQEYGPPKQVPYQEYGPPKQEYGPPKQEYGPPKQIPHQQYGPPPQQPPREYGVPVLKYGPPKINLEYGAPSKKPFFNGGSIGGGGGGGGIFNSLFSGKNSLFDQFKSHFGGPKTQYGPPHSGARPLALKNTYLPSGSAPVYGPPKPLLQPSSNYGPPAPVYGPPAPVYGPPKPVYGPPQLSHSKPAPVYGPPEFSHKPAPVYGPPSTSYGVPVGGHGLSSSFELPNKHVQIFESNHLGSGGSGGHSVSCDGWKPIPAPAGLHSGGGGGGGGTSYNGLTDEQIIAVALHSDGQGGNAGHQQLPLTGGIDDFHSGGGNIDAFKSNSIEFSHSGGGNHGDFGLVPPSGVYGVPPGGSYHGSGHGASSGLAINYGTISGNSKPWHSGGLPPRRPVSFRAPVPQGFLESIGASVQHLDTYGVKPLHEPQTYIPPPTVPSNHHQHHHQQYQQPQYQHQQHQQHFESHGGESINFGQSLPNFQEPRFNQAQDCGHGPNLQGGGFDIASNQVHYDHSSGGFDQGGATVSADYIAGGLSDSYGPPPAGNPHDAIGFESKQNSVSIVHAESQATAEPSHSALVQNEQGNSGELPGLEGLNVVSAQKSHSISIPVQSTSGSSYQVQFQSTNPVGSHANPGEQSGHDQVLSEGLLQSILSAIEQPNAQLEPSAAESRVDHKDVSEFLNSPEGKKVLDDDTNETHK